MSSTSGLKKTKTIKQINEEGPGIEVEDEDEEEDTSVGDSSSVQGQEEEKEEDDDEEDVDDEESDVDQWAINMNWIKALDCNYPLKTYYKHVKKNLQIVIGSERIPAKKYPKWSENLYSTFKKLT